MSVLLFTNNPINHRTSGDEPGLGESRKVAKSFHNSIARFEDPHTKPAQFSAVIDWGDQSGSTPGKVRRTGSGRYQIVGSHRYQAPSVFQVTVTIRDTAGEVIAAHRSVKVAGK